mmetsp:Transcript_116512/g.329540  ORF Transcript_116512/g.329540 Transcript_116512/m.329540 type:complete len:243 (+) Transcript_116512:302-1030(+)
MASAAAWAATRVASAGGSPETTPLLRIVSFTLPPHNVQRGPETDCTQSATTQALQPTIALQLTQHLLGSGLPSMWWLHALSSKRYSTPGSSKPHWLSMEWRTAFTAGEDAAGDTAFPCDDPTAADRPNSRVAAMASWSLPPLPTLPALISDERPMLLKMLSTPPNDSPLWMRTRCFQSSWIVNDAALALKSPTRTITSPLFPLSATRFKRLCAVETPPHSPPEFTCSGPWWFTKRSVPLVRV